MLILVMVADTSWAFMFSFNFNNPIFINENIWSHKVTARTDVRASSVHVYPTPEPFFLTTILFDPQTIKLHDHLRKNELLLNFHLSNLRKVKSTNKNHYLTCLRQLGLTEFRCVNNNFLQSWTSVIQTKMKWSWVNLTKLKWNKWLHLSEYEIGTFFFSHKPSLPLSFTSHLPIILPCANVSESLPRV